ncbi:hypothetical protein AB1Y20_015285 [Prymnesium parvum]|uniref:Fe2OG dioxygenase domain-containing protein n=1 Tax=Prymnesium parvum TaxID=97485 RepID=A0AB34JWN7_PRYPA
MMMLSGQPSALLLAAALLLLPAAVSAGLDPIRLIFVAFILGTGALSLRRPRPAAPAPRQVRPSRAAVIEDLRHAAAASAQATKLSFDGPPASARTERPASTLLKRRRRWEISADHLGRLTVLSHSPPLHACGGFLRPEECAQLIGTAARVLVRSTVYGHALDASRTSRSCLLARTRPECRAALEKVLALSGALPEQVEDPQVTCYTRGQRYEPHCDGPELHDPQGQSFLQCGGQRLLTVLIYLNAVPRGGRTRFSQLGVEVAPEQGKAIVFAPAFLDGEIDAALVHEALPAEDEKWVCQFWIRQRPDTTGVFMHNPDAQ